ncbi:Atxe2 family lasso peptide isopeptidase [Sphingomonas sp.]|uniref:Atxe2 family lasso peptide isopeptidase n=1 Tax=Sphingomonas sp. TaxID=28214 RepID=UPI0031E38F05
MARLFRRIRLLVTLAALAVWALPAAAGCDGWNPLGAPTSVGSFDANTLTQLVGIGRPDAEPTGGPSPLAISPDRHSAAFILQRADIATNSYCQALVVIDLQGGAAPRIADRGGAFISTTVTMRGTAIATGYPAQIIPRWSPDGMTIGFVKRVGGAVQLWLASSRGERARQLTNGPIEVVEWAWLRDGRIGVARAAERMRAERAIDAEGVSGWVYDQRVLPNAGFRPQPTSPLPLSYDIIDAQTGTVRPAEGEDLAQLRAALTAGGNAQAVNSDGARATLIATAASPLAARRLQLINTAGALHRCEAAACLGQFQGLWASGSSFYFLKREGWHQRHTGLYRWRSGAVLPDRLWATDEVVERCTQAGARLLCIREGSTHPAHIVEIELSSGTVRTLFDPNPGIAARIRAHVERVTWRAPNGLEVYGDLVLPPGERGGRPLPTIVTLYRSRGFLRGGTGNEYPIFLFAQRGYAVLSIERPALFAANQPELTSYDAIYAANVKDWADRRSVHGAIAAGLDLLVARGIADPAKLGITGLSEGAAAVRFALINSRLFAAAALSSCCVDESSAALAGPAWQAYSRSVGYPDGVPLDERFWEPGSLPFNAAKISTPLLMQLADSEALLALPSIAALQQFRQPTELRVFPGEHHIKSQPQHRHAIYQTNLDWFDFWLQGRIDPDARKADQYRRWKELQADRLARSANPSLTRSAPRPRHRQAASAAHKPFRASDRDPPARPSPPPDR